MELGNLPRNGEVVQARVIAMLNGGMARLAIFGQTIDVSAPRTFQAGTSIAVAVVRDGPNLKLVLQQEAQAAPQQSVGGSAAPPRADAAALLPAAARAAIIGALLGGSSNPLGASPAADGSSAQGQPAGMQAADAQPQGTVQPRYEPAAIPQALAYADNQQSAQLSSTAASSNTHAAQQTMPGVANPAAQNPAQAILIPFQLPQMAQPVMLKIEEQREDDEDGSGGQPGKRIWTVSVSLDAGALGLVHIGIGLREGAVSVRLSAGDPQGTAHLSTWLPELKASLEQADFVAGELSAVQAPPQEAAGQGQPSTI